MALSGAGTEDFAGGGDFEPLCNRFLCFNTFWATHKFCFLSKRARNIGRVTSLGKRILQGFCALTKLRAAAVGAKLNRLNPIPSKISAISATE